MRFIEQMQKVTIVEDSAESPQIHSEWELLKNRMAKKLELAKDTSILIRGNKELNEPSRQLDLDEMPANRKPDTITIVNDLGPDKNSYSLLRQIKAGTISAKQLNAEA